MHTLPQLPAKYNRHPISVLPNFQTLAPFNDTQKLSLILQTITIIWTAMIQNQQTDQSKILLPTFCKVSNIIDMYIHHNYPSI